MEKTRKKRNTTKSLNNDNSRDRLMTEGYKLICKKGIDGVGVREIAEAANVSTGTFYYFFTDKLDLLSCYTFEKNNFILDETASSGESVYKRIINFFTNVVATVLENDGYDVAMWVLMKKETSPKLYDSLYKLVLEGIESGEFTNEKTPDKLTTFILDSYRGAAFAWYRSNGEFDLRILLEEHVGFGLKHFVR